MLPHNHNINLATNTAEVGRLHRGRRAAVGLPAVPRQRQVHDAGRGDGLRRAGRSSTGASPRAASGTSAARERVTAFNGMGEMLRILLKQPDRPEDAENPVRVVIGAAAPRELVEEFEQRYGLAILDVYGLTETGPITFNRFEKRRAGLDGRAGPVVRGPHPRRERHGGPRRRAGGDLHPPGPAQRDDDGLLGQRHGDAQDDAEPVVPHRRPRAPRRRRLLLLPRPRDGLDPPARRERVGLGGRARAGAASGPARVRGLRRSPPRSAARR